MVKTSNLRISKYICIRDQKRKKRRGRGGGGEERRRRRRKREKEEEEEKGGGGEETFFNSQFLGLRIWKWFRSVTQSFEG